jgi:sialate O-acetylesterase
MAKLNPRWLAILLTTQPLTAQVTLAPLFQDGAVLQREKPVPIWGRAGTGKEVTVTFGEQSKTTTADASGRWEVALAAMPANATGKTLRVTETGSPAVEVNDVLVGEVWIGSGQSNMQWSVAQTRKENQEIAAKGPIPLLRLFDVPRVLNLRRQESVKSKWTLATPETARKFSAVAYFFGKQLTEELNVPVGMIHSSWGGSRIEPWWAEEGLEGIKELAPLRTTRQTRLPGFPGYDQPFRSYMTAVREWSIAAENAIDAGKPYPEMPTQPEHLKIGHNAETGTYQAMIHPLVPYALRGFLWYQGESNNGEGMLYTAKKQALIAGWRKQFRNPEAPFLFVQLAPYNYGANRKFDLPGIWWAQQETLKIPNTGMAVTNDIGNVKDIHPDQKAEVARRLALWALADTYHKPNLVKSGPLFANYKVTGASIAIQFNHLGSGLITRDGKAPNHFEIAGVDAVYHPAEATISADGKFVQLTSPNVPTPDRARFAWSQTAEPNLTNREGLPAAAFNTHWPADPTLGKNISRGKPHASSSPNPHGWDSGLTDGLWGNTAGTCFATDPSPAFPKFVTVDLGASQVIHAVNYGTPDIGSTKTVSISISEDGQAFNEVGRQSFPPKQATRAMARFSPTKARFIRASFIEQHPTQDNFDKNFGFLAELEVYAP